MPGYAMFMKDLVTKKRSVTFEDDDRMQYYSVIATRSLVQKKEDLGAFTIPCTVGSLHFVKALCDLGASINLGCRSMRQTGELQSVSAISHKEKMKKDNKIKIEK